jgi:nitroreductase
MDILKLIKERKTIRKYQDKPVPQEIIDKIIEAGIWAPSAHNSQPWYFLIVSSRSLKEKLVIILKRPPRHFLTSIKILISKTAEIIENAPNLILVYNTGVFSNRVKKLGEPYFSNARISEIESISAAIENMHLVATSFGIGMAWLTMPLLLKREINKLLDTKNELVAVLTLGYSLEKGIHLPRKLLSETSKYIK